MKITFKYILPCLALACMSSCYDTMDDKHDVEAGWGSTEATPVEVKNVEVVSATSVEIIATMPAGKIIEAGAVVSNSADDFSDAKFYPCEVEESATTFKATAKLTPNTTCYVGTYVINIMGVRTISKTQQVTTPDLPFTADMVYGTFASGTFADAWGDSYKISDLIIKADPEVPNGVIICDLDPYFAGYGYVAANGFQVYKGIIDTEAKTITIANGQAVGYPDVSLIGMDNADPDEAEAFDDIHIKIEDYGETLIIQNTFGTMASDGFWSLYPGNLVLKKK